MSAEVKKRRPRKRKWRHWNEGELHRGTYLVPNLFTTANLFAGFFGIVNSINGRYEMAAVAVLMSCVFDILDGKVARLTGATSRFGVEYDSLADLVSFGVGPGLLMYLWALKPFGRVGWLAAFVFVACGALRLARFNVQVEVVNKRYFVGLPIPGAAAMVSTSVLFLNDRLIPGSWAMASTVILLVATYLLGFLMVSTVPYNSFKDMEITRTKPMAVIFVSIVIVTIIAIHPELMLFSLLSAYVLSGPVLYLVRKVRNPQPSPSPEGPPESGTGLGEQDEKTV
ncbi:MAG: CDP-diacylglycerol--serine O-phosphatidyltransferase [Syntrophobacteraceae bacterium]|nr:CDP-diacylglycerol--serine O-phosphatidyltransferase [Syntrophobacteraceae bacterium]